MMTVRSTTRSAWHGPPVDHVGDVAANFKRRS
jgi:hypothetical protein